MKSVLNTPVPMPTPPPNCSPKMKMSEVKAKMMMCPAVMLAVRRTIRTNGLMKMLAISIGTRMNLIGRGTPAGQRMWLQ